MLAHAARRLAVLLRRRRPGLHHSGASAQQFRSRSILNLWRSRQRLYERFYGPLRRSLAAGIVHLGMQAEMRRARLAAAHGLIDAEELAQRVQAARQVAATFGARHRT